MASLVQLHHRLVHHHLRPSVQYMKNLHQSLTTHQPLFSGVQNSL